jgi:glycosyltransferase involved in cell wall biosynthesis
VIDDGSTDTTEEVVTSVRDPRLRYVRSKHLGIPAIVNAGFELCRGEYVIVCHDHDSYDPDFLRELAQLLDRHPSATYAHSGVVILDPSGTNETMRFIYDYPELADGREFLTRHLLQGTASPVTAISMVRRSSLNGAFLDPRYMGCADVELWMRLSLIGDVAYTPRPLLRLRERDSTSLYFQRLHELTELVLRAKESYLSEISDLAARRRAVRNWQADANLTGLAALCSALEHNQEAVIPGVKQFVRRRGTPAGALAIELISLLPKPIGASILRALRRIRHLVRPIHSRLAHGTS